MTTETNQYTEQTQSEVELKTQAFRDHVEHQQSIKRLNAERDDLIAELARRAKLLDLPTFQYFKDQHHGYVKQGQGMAFFPREKPSFEEYQEQLREMIDSLLLDKFSDPQAEKLGSVLGLVYSLFIDKRLQEVDDALKTAFPEYYITQVGNE